MHFATLLLAAASTASAHFTLTTPTTVGFNDDSEGNGPCGGATIDFSKNTVTDFAVGGSPVGMKTGHPSTKWLFRGTLDQTGASGWTKLYPIVLQNSIGTICQPAIPAPAGWVGKKGLVGVVANGDDGVLYQCAAVNFVSGMGSTAGVTCTNVTDNNVAFTTDSTLDGMATATASNTSTGGTTGTTGGSGATSPSPTNAAAGVVPREMMSVGNALVVVFMGALGAAYVL